MKKITFLLLGTFLIFSCTKKTHNSTLQKGIAYPDSIYFGKNILSYADSTLLSETSTYEMGAILEKDASLYLVFTNYSDTTPDQPIWGYMNETGWVGTIYDNTTGVQKFIATQSGKIDLQMLFRAWGSQGKCKIDFYENGNILTKSKYFIWK